MEIIRRVVNFNLRYTLRFGQKGDILQTIFQCIVVIETLIQMSMKSIPKGIIGNKSLPVYVMGRPQVITWINGDYSPLIHFCIRTFEVGGFGELKRVNNM